MLFLAFVTIPAWGYNFTKDFINGFYWHNLPINITITEGNSSRKAMLQQLAKQAIGEWESRTGLSIWNFKSTGGTSNIIRWSTKFAAETNMDATSVLAVAIRYTEGPYFARTEIVINGNHPDIKASNSNILTTLTHELGHTIGLDHSDDWNAVMAPTLQEPYYGLDNDDISGMTEAHETTIHRQVTKYVSPLASEKTESSSSPLSCGTVQAAGTGMPATTGNGLVSLTLGMLIGFIRKIFKWFKSWM